MATSADNLGEKLRTARLATGKSTRVVAREATMKGIPMSHATLANYERGHTMPALPTLRLLASIYNYPVDQFLGSAPALAGIRYRALKSVRVQDRRYFEGEVARWYYLYFELENLLDRPLKKYKHLKIKNGKSGKELAGNVRSNLNLGKGPIPSVVKLLEHFGVRVIQIHTEARIDGLSAMYGQNPIVALNPSSSNDRFRFNAAHELGHHLFEDWQDEAGRDHDGDNRAHEFASNLLLPDSEVKEAFKGFSMVRMVYYKELFGISLAAMVYRGKQLDLINQKNYEQIWREFGRLGWRKKEPGYVKPDYTLRLEQLIEQAVNKRIISYADVARLTGIEENVIRRRVLEAIGGSPPEEPEVPKSFSFPGCS